MNKIEITQEALSEILKFIGVDPKVDVTEDSEGNIFVNLEGNDLSFLIGYRGESLDSLQTFLALIVYKKTSEWAHVILDINGYKKQKSEKIEQITRTYIDKVRFFGKEIEMNPMPASERRQVHTFVGTYDDVVSESTGEGQSRRVVLKPKKA